MVASGVSVLAVLAILAQAQSCPLTCGSYNGEYLGSFGSGVVSAPAVVSSPAVAVSSSPIVSASPVLSSGFVGSNGLAQVQERVSSGTYTVALDNNGPVSTRALPVLRTQATAPVQQRPTVRIPANIPAPRTVSNSCKCVKTVVKPQVIEQVVTVPSIQRYIQTTSRPVVERIHYNAVPVNSGASAAAASGFGLDVDSSLSGYSGFSGLSGLSGLSGYTGFSGSCGLQSVAPVVESAPVCASAPVVASSCESSYPVVSTSSDACL